MSKYNFCYFNENNVDDLHACMDMCMYVGVCAWMCIRECECCWD